MNRRRLRFALATVALVAVSAWFRVTDLPQARAADRDPARALGLGAAFDAELAKVGQLSPKQFADKYGRRADHLPKLTWNPTTAEYWDRLNLDPNKPGQRIRLRGEEERQARQRARQQRLFPHIADATLC